MMSLTELKPTDLFAIEVEKDMSAEIRGMLSKNYELLSFYGEMDAIQLPDNTNFNILGEVTKDSISFDVEPYVFKSNIRTYKDYNYSLTEKLDEVGLFNALLMVKFKTPQESFYSLLKANGIDINAIKGKLIILKKVK